jgi:hypothetical protein
MIHADKIDYGGMREHIKNLTDEFVISIVSDATGYEETNYNSKNAEMQYKKNFDFIK